MYAFLFISLSIKHDTTNKHDKEKHTRRSTYNRVIVALGVSTYPSIESLKPGQTLTITKSLLAHSRKRSWPKVEGDLKDKLSKLSVKDLSNLSRYEALPWYIYVMNTFLRNVEYADSIKPDLESNAGRDEWDKKVNSVQDRMNKNNSEIATNAYRGSMHRNKEALTRCLVECITKGPLYDSWRKNITTEFKAFFNNVPPVSFGDAITVEENLNVMIEKKIGKTLSWPEFVDLFSVYVRIWHNQENPHRDAYIY